MKDKMYYIAIGYGMAIITAMTVSCVFEPVNAVNTSGCGDSEWNPCWVRLSD